MTPIFPGSETEVQVRPNKKNFLPQVISILLSAGIISLMVSHWMEMSKAKTDIDYLNDLLQHVKEMEPDHSTISFITNHQQSKDIYFKTQFAMVPKIVTNDLKNDTVLMIEIVDKKSPEINNVDTLYMFSNYMFNVKLVRKIN